MAARPGWGTGSIAAASPAQSAAAVAPTTAGARQSRAAGPISSPSTAPATKARTARPASPAARQSPIHGDAPRVVVLPLMNET